MGDILDIGTINASPFMYPYHPHVEALMWKIPDCHSYPNYITLNVVQILWNVALALCPTAECCADTLMLKSQIQQTLVRIDVEKTKTNLVKCGASYECRLWMHTNQVLWIVCIIHRFSSISHVWGNLTDSTQYTPTLDFFVKISCIKIQMNVRRD